LTKTKDHVNNLEKMFKENGINCSTYFGSKKKFSDERVLIGSLSKISTGFDYSSVARDFDGVMSDTLILAATIKKETLLRQTLGRVNGRSENPSIIYLIDRNVSQARHFNGTKEMILKAKGEIIELQYNDEVPGGGVVL
jgi:superfamily II DNA or RNA helicase